MRHGNRKQTPGTGVGGAQYYLRFSSHCRILIRFVGMTLLIVSYGVNTVQMSAELSRNKVVSSVNNSHGSSHGNASNSSAFLMNESHEKNGMNAHLLQSSWPIPRPGVNGDVDTADDGGKSAQKENASVGRFINLRQSRLLGLFALLGTNFSLAYNLTIGSGSSTIGNITVAPAPAPAYYYAPAPYYPYSNPYSYYDPYAYNPYAYNPYAYSPYAGYYYG